MGSRRLAVTLLIVIGAATGAAQALTADEIVLVVNAAEPESLRLAEFYAAARGVPGGRIVELSLPTGDELSAGQYDRDVVEPLRLALIRRNLRGRVRCLVTVYGVPLRVAAAAPAPRPDRDATAAVDSELALLWRPTYDRAGWRGNGLHFAKPPSDPNQLMVTRLDGPTPQAVRDLIAGSVTAERDGLRGKLVVDAGGGAMLDPDGRKGGYRPFDDALAGLAALVREETAVEVVHDDRPAVLPAGSVADVALYTGWYSVRNYVPACDFAPGAVGYHVASYELLNLHDPREKGWARGLLGSGVVATVGPVREPFLHAFPPPGEFFPLLMTGKLTLAEVYWRTTPTVSWMMTLVGDPLYTPYKHNPAMTVDDLPAALRGAVEREGD